MSVTVTFNVQDALSNAHLNSVVFIAADGSAAQLVNSPFTHSYAAGTFYPSIEVAGYKGKVSQVIVDADPVTVNVTLAELLDVTHSLYENLYMDEPVYSTNNVLTSCRIRIYSDSAIVGTDSNVLFTYLMTATETNGKVLTYKTVKA